MADFGKQTANYTPGTIAYSGQIAKIARQVIESEEIKSKYDIFEKEPIENGGKDIEVTIYEAATGVAYSPTTEPNAPNPVGNTLIFKTLTEKTYPVRINSWEIEKGALNLENAQRVADAVVGTLYDGDREDKNAQVEAILTAAAAGEPGALGGATQIVSAGEYSPVTDKTSAEAVVEVIKTVSRGMRIDPARYNPVSLKKPAEQVALIMPYDLKAKIDTYLFAASSQPDYLNYGVDAVIEAATDDIGGAIYIVDYKYIQMYTRKFKYAEEPEAGTDSVKAFLHTSRIYAGCPLFCAVKLPKAAG